MVVSPRRSALNASFLSGCLCLLFLGFYNFTLWQKLSSYAQPPFMFALGFCVACTFYSVMCLVSSKYLYKPVLILILLIAALSAYAMDSFGYVITTEAFRNITETDNQEILDLLNWRLLAYITCLFILPSLVLLHIKVRYPSIKRRLLYFFLSLTLCVGNIVLLHRHYVTLFRNHLEIKYYINPMRPVYSVLKFSYLQLKPGVVKELLELDPNPTRAAAIAKPKLVILVVGESDRAVNQQLNGYARATNPLLAKRTDVLSFKQFYSCGTETTVSVPCMFSMFKREEYTHHKGRYTENVLDLLQKSQVEVLWRDNDGGCKNVCDRITTHDLNAATIKPYCNDIECHDEVLLHDLAQYINNNIADKLIILHKKGNHGPAYYRRYPGEFAKFAPTCASNELQKCTTEQIVNTYDNIILYTDYFLDKIIQQLEKSNNKFQTALIYVSDHGESLGENGVFLHALPYWLAPKEQTHVPFIFWASADFALNREKLLQLSEQQLSHDHLFHSLLGLFNVKSVVYDQELDMFS